MTSEELAAWRANLKDGDFVWFEGDPPYRDSLEHGPIHSDPGEPEEYFWSGHRHNYNVSREDCWPTKEMAAEAYKAFWKNEEKK